MSMSALLEIVIGLVVLFWLAASVCSFLVETLWSTMLNLRAKALQRFVCEMVIGTDRLRFVDGWLLRSRAGSLEGSPTVDPLALLSHPLITSLRKPALKRSGRSTAPSYIPAETFATVLLTRLAELQPALRNSAPFRDALQRLHRRPSALDKQLGTAADPLQAVCEWATKGRIRQRLCGLRQRLLKSTPQSSAAKQLATALGRVVDELRANHAWGNPPPDAGTLWVLVARALGHTPVTQMPQAHIGQQASEVVRQAPLPTPLREALLPMVDAAIDPNALHTAVANWYRDVMDRATGWFKRHTTMALGICGFSLAVLFNINPIWLARDLGADPALRKAVATLGDQIADGSPERVTLAQRALFVRAADSRGWRDRAQRVATGDPDGDGNRHLQVLALEMAPLLVTAPGYAGLALSALTGSLSPQDRTANAFLASLCRAYVGATRPADAALVASQIKARDGDPRNVAACSELMEPFIKNPSDLYDTLWSHRMVIWDPELGGAVRAILRDSANTGAPGAHRAQAQRLADRLEPALEGARRADAKLHDLWSRLPSLGNHRAVLGNTCDVLVSLVGWLLMAVAVSLGASFWYELLSKITNRRGTGPRPDGHASDG